MENKINIAELLKDCPKGMELNCTMYENVEFDYIEQNSELTYPIHCLMKINGGYNALVFTRNGCNDRHPNAKCVIFPKGKTTWEGFQRPFKDGDVAISDVGDIHLLHSKDSSYCAYKKSWGVSAKFDSTITTCIKVVRLATEEEKQELFDAIKSNGYKWNEETKTLEKLVRPRFKVGDRIKAIINNNQYDIKELTDTHYTLVEVECKFKYTQPISEDKNWELVPDKFDITTLKPFDKVLVRDNDLQKWFPALWGYYDFDSQNYPYKLVGDVACYCIPYEGNEHLLGTTDDCDEYYKIWE